MINFKTYLTEAIRANAFAKAAVLIKQYLQKKLGKVYYFPTPEVFNPNL